MDRNIVWFLRKSLTVTAAKKKSKSHKLSPALKNLPGAENLNSREQRIFVRRTLSTYQTMKGKAAPQDLPFSIHEWRLWVLACLGQPCRYCQEKLRPKIFSADHANPVARGGSLALDNIHLICQGCNKAKGILSDAEFSQLVDLLKTWEPRIRGDVIGRLKVGQAQIRRLRGGGVK
jgi:5-methylcytosine-specific restriction endonuclease McrA